MNIKEVFDAKAETIGDVMTGKHAYYIPAYQRKYRWNNERLQQLVEDIVDGLKESLHREDSLTFIGTCIFVVDHKRTTIVPALQPHLPDSIRLVIDGQQRLTSLLLLVVRLHDLLRCTIVSVDKALNSKQKGKKFNDEELTLLESVMHIGKQILAKLMHVVSLSPNDAELVNRYPRVIRAFKDQWSFNKQTAIYLSPLAHLLASYISYCDARNAQAEKSDEPWKYNHKELVFSGEASADDLGLRSELENRYEHLSSQVGKLLILKNLNSELEDLSTLRGVTASAILDSAIANQYYFKLGENKAVLLRGALAKAGPSSQALHVYIALSKFLLDNVVITVVEAQNEDYAFEMFEALNDRGAPLTTVETFMPLVIQTVGLADYNNSEHFRAVQPVENYLGRFDADKAQDKSKAFLSAFALAEAGHKLSGKRKAQRDWLKTGYAKAVDGGANGLPFLKMMGYVANQFLTIWDPPENKGVQVREPYSLIWGHEKQQMSAEADFALEYLRHSEHAITIPILSRFFMNWVEAGGSERVQAKTDFEEIVKALAAFQALWRTSRANSDGIDDVHRFLMSGRRSEAFLKDCPSVSALARRIKDENCSLRDPKFVRHQLRLFLKHASPSIGQKADWLNTLAFTPVYKAAPHAKFVLLLAGQHAVKDVSNPGLQKKGDNGGVKYIDYTSSQAQWTIEHVQPQATVKQTWGSDQLLHTLGNLTLLPQPVNSMLSDQSWVIKRKVFTLLTSGEELTLDKARAAGMSQATSQFIANHNASWKKSHLLGLADVVDWTPEHVQARSKNLGELAFLTLEKWIGFYE